MKPTPRVFLATALALLALAQPARGELPDPVRFGVRMEYGDVAQARDYIAGYTIFNDFSARDIQLR